MDNDITVTGNLAELPSLRLTRDDKEYLTGRIIASTRELSDSGEWVTRGTMGFNFVIFNASLARAIHDLAERCGNVRLTLTGVVEFTDWAEGGKHGTKIEIKVKDATVPVRGQKVSVTMRSSDSLDDTRDGEN